MNEETLNYKKTSYEELHEHVLNYNKNSDMQSAEFILNAFKGLIWNYVSVICIPNKFKVYNKRQREFVALFCPKNISKMSDSWHFRSLVNNSLESAAEHIQYTFKSYEVEDIQSECQIVLLQMAKLYKIFDKPMFHTFVARYYHKKLYDRLKKLIKDPFTRGDNYCYVNFLDDSLSIENCLWHGTFSPLEDFSKVEKQIDFDLMIERRNITNINPIDINTINEDWINGVTSSELFNVLTPTEKQIIKLYYHDGIKDKQIGDLLTFSKSSINAKRNKAINKLRKYIKENGMLLYT